MGVKPLSDQEKKKKKEDQAKALEEWRQPQLCHNVLSITMVRHISCSLQFQFARMFV